MSIRNSSPIHSLARFFGVLASGIFTLGCTAEIVHAEVSCPDQLSVQQRADPPAGWSVQYQETAPRLSAVTIYDGPPRNRVSLKYDQRKQTARELISDLDRFPTVRAAITCSAATSAPPRKSARRFLRACASVEIVMDRTTSYPGGGLAVKRMSVPLTLPFANTTTRRSCRRTPLRKPYAHAVFPSRHATVLLSALLPLPCSASARECAEPIPDLFARTSPAVVMISGQAINPFRLRDRVGRALGSGFIIDRRVWCSPTPMSCTACNRCGEARRWHRCARAPGRRRSHLRRGCDPTAHARSRQASDDKAGRLGQGAPGRGVIAIGNPLGLDQTVTRGIISGINRLLPETPLSLTEPLDPNRRSNQPGKLGRPAAQPLRRGHRHQHLYRPRGTEHRLRGAHQSGQVALPALIKDGRVIRPWVGFHGQVIGDDVKTDSQASAGRWVPGGSRRAGQPADKAGIRGGSLEFSIGGDSLLLGGDVIVSVNGIAADRSG